MAKLALRWTKIALSDLESAFDFLINEDKPQTATKILQRILKGVEQTRSFPDSGRTGRVKGTRELVVATTPFIIVYREKNESIEVLTILHHAKKWK